MRFLAYLWALPITALGLILALIARVSGGTMHFRQGIVEVCGGFIGPLLRGNRFWNGGAAMTLGHVILARNADCLERSRQHELRHVRQFERWGPLLLPLYWLIGVWLRWRGLHPYLDHPIEE